MTCRRCSSASYPWAQTTWRHHKIEAMALSLLPRLTRSATSWASCTTLTISRCWREERHHDDIYAPRSTAPHFELGNRHAWLRWLGVGSNSGREGPGVRNRGTDTYGC